MMHDEAERQIPVLAALGQATRLRILTVVAEAGVKGRTAGEVARALHCPASTLSFHLKEMSNAGILEAQPRGRFVIYALRRDVLEELAWFIARLGAPDPSRVARPRGAGRRRSDRRVRAIDRAQLSMFGD